MSNFYPYLLSSLPFLRFGMKPPFSFERFLQMCHQLIPQSDYEALALLPRDIEKTGERSGVPLLAARRELEATLRNELVKVRAIRRHKDPQKYMRPDADAEPEMVRRAMSAVRNPSPLGAEQELDLERWGILDRLEHGHFFDREALLVYGCKLLIVERWERIRSADKQELIRELVVSPK
jgi:hypothetical protein